MRFCLLLWCCEIDVFFVAAIKMDLPPQQAVIFSEAEIQTALKMYLATTLVRLWTDDYTLETIQDMDGMCLRKQSLQSALSGLVQCDFLQRNKKTNAYSLSSTIRNVASMGCVAQPQKQQQPLFPSTLILERLYLYLQSRTKGLAGKDDTWSEASMQDEDWPNMCLRKKTVTKMLDMLCEQRRVFQKGPSLYSMCAPTQATTEFTEKEPCTFGNFRDSCITPPQAATLTTPSVILPQAVIPRQETVQGKMSTSKIISLMIAQSMGLDANGRDADGYRDPAFLPSLYASDSDY